MLEGRHSSKVASDEEPRVSRYDDDAGLVAKARGALRA